MRAGNIYLSLSDAIALAIENNLDIELERYTSAHRGSGAVARQRRRIIARACRTTSRKRPWA